jgi:hypothetical protein
MPIMRKRRITWRVLLGAMLGLYLGWQAGGLLSAAPANKGPLEGKWKVDVTASEENAGEKGYKDILTFKVDETFNSEKFKKAGFKDATYEVDQRPYGPAQFKVTLTDDKQGEIKFTGVATGQNINGEI